MRRLIAAMALAGVLAACGTVPAPDHVVIQTVNVPVPVPCSVSPGAEPVWFDADAAIAAVPAGGILDLARLYAAGRQQHLDWEARLTAANSGCLASVARKP